MNKSNMIEKNSSGKMHDMQKSIIRLTVAQEPNYQYRESDETQQPKRFFATEAHHSRGRSEMFRTEFMKKVKFDRHPI